MAGAVGNKFFDWFLKAVLAGGPGSTSVNLHLFTNSPVITKNSVFADFTEPGGGLGYAAIVIPSGSFTVALAGGVEKATLGTQTFTLTGAVTINGYFVSDNANTLFYWGETGGPFAFSSAGGTLGVSLELDGP
jgi:hypothetical protein